MSSQFAIRMNAQAIDYQDTDTSRGAAWSRLMLVLEKQSTGAKWGIVLGLMLAIAWLDQVTGWELSLLAVHPVHRHCRIPAAPGLACRVELGPRLASLSHLVRSSRAASAHFFQCPEGGN